MSMYVEDFCATPRIASPTSGTCPCDFANDYLLRGNESNLKLLNKLFYDEKFNSLVSKQMKK